MTMFKLAEKRASNRGLYCGEEGLYLGPAALVERGRGGYLIRSEFEAETLLAAAYASSPDVARCLAGLRRLAAHLRERNTALAQIAAVQLRLPEIPDDRIERAAQTDALLKANFNPDEPRDDHGRWTDEGRADNESAGNIVPAGAGHEASPASMKFPNTGFRNRLAVAEQTADRPDFGYREVHYSTDPQNTALGRYQMTPLALQAAGLMDRSGNWTGKYGIHSQAQFLADPEAQEEALSDYLTDNERRLKANGAYAHLGETIEGLKATFTVTRAGLLAASHREGPAATGRYLDRVMRNGATSRGLTLGREDLAIETRLRTFSDVPYE